MKCQLQTNIYAQQICMFITIVNIQHTCNSYITQLNQVEDIPTFQEARAYSDIPINHDLQKNRVIPDLLLIYL